MKTASAALLAPWLAVGVAAAQTSIIVEATSLPETVNVDVSHVVVDGQVAVQLASAELFPTVCTVVFDSGPDRTRRSVKLGIRGEGTAVYRIRRPTTQRVRLAVDCQPLDDENP
jgi:hypothetical protein